ncbi:MAG: hypothetical protein CL561_02740 [Alphaproteobacteria bacterium]|nr:hypothetical protein [Alphaproteobacteria bacterium]
MVSSSAQNKQYIYVVGDTKPTASVLHAEKKKPLVMAFIGLDDPYRGDSRGAAGVGRIAAKLLDGRYEYVDADSLSKTFNHVSGYENQLAAYAEQINQAGGVDILIGSTGEKFIELLEKKPVIIEGRFNEKFSESRAYMQDIPMGLVSHDLSQDKLNKEGAAFDLHYPNIKGSLIAVMMGGACIDIHGIVENIISKLKHETGPVTLFVCPSRRTEEYYQEFLDELALQRKDNFPELTVMGKEYNKAISSYNPYYGLLANANHIVLVGESGSMISEALYTGKPLHMAHMVHVQMSPLIDQGYIIDMAEVQDRPFISPSMPRLDVTMEVASSIVLEYKEAKDALACVLKRSAGGGPMI